MVIWVLFPVKIVWIKATLRHAAKDRNELGFMDDFVQPNPQIARFLDKLNIDMLAYAAIMKIMVF